MPQSLHFVQYFIHIDFVLAIQKNYDTDIKKECIFDLTCGIMVIDGMNPCHQ
jgi:hypothetical protein